MGKKASKRKTLQSKKTHKYKLDNKFNCPMCNHEKVVTCRSVKADLKGIARCSVCEANYICRITKLDQAIDIYNKWLDAENGE